MIDIKLAVKIKNIKELDRYLRSTACSLVGWLQKTGIVPDGIASNGGGQAPGKKQDMASFVAEACIQGDDCRVLPSELHKAYLEWASAKGLPLLGRNEFYRRFNKAYPIWRKGRIGTLEYLLGISISPKKEMTESK